MFLEHGMFCCAHMFWKLSGVLMPLPASHLAFDRPGGCAAHASRAKSSVFSPHLPTLSRQSPAQVAGRLAAFFPWLFRVTPGCVRELQTEEYIYIYVYYM